MYADVQKVQSIFIGSLGQTCPGFDLLFSLAAKLRAGRASCVLNKKTHDNYRWTHLNYSWIKEMRNYIGSEAGYLGLLHLYKKKKKKERLFNFKCLFGTFEFQSHMESYTDIQKAVQIKRVARGQRSAWVWPWILGLSTVQALQLWRKSLLLLMLHIDSHFYVGSVWTGAPWTGRHSITGPR